MDNPGNNVKVSLILPSLNVGRYIEECIESAMHQTLKEIEIICVDAGSTDGTLEIIKKYAGMDERIQLIPSDQKSYGHQMNLGMEAATGEYIGILETDDIVPPEMYEELYEAAFRNRADLVKADFYRFTGSGEDMKKDLIRVTGKRPDCYNRVIDVSAQKECFNFVMNTWSGIYRREFLIENNIWHHETPGASFQDNGFWFQTFLHARRAYFVDKAYYMNRRDREDSSVFDTKSVFAICEEYDWIEEKLRETGAYEEYGPLHAYFAFRNYKWTLDRILYEDKPAFYQRLREKFEGYWKSGVIDYRWFRMFNESLALSLWAILNRPEDYYRVFYQEQRLAMENIPSDRPVIIYGAGGVGKDCRDDFLKLGRKKQVAYFAVTRADGEEEPYHDVPVRGIEELTAWCEDATAILAVKPAFRNEMMANLLRLGFQDIRQWPDLDYVLRTDFAPASQQWQGELAKGYVFPYGKVKRGSRILLCGDTRIAESYHEQMEQTGYAEVVQWVGENSSEYAGILPIEPLDAVGDVSYDCVLVAYEDAPSARDAGWELLARGVPAERMVWMDRAPEYVMDRIERKEQLLRAEAEDCLGELQEKLRQEKHALYQLVQESGSSVIPRIVLRGTAGMEQAMADLDAFLEKVGACVSLQIAIGKELSGKDLETIASSLPGKEKVWSKKLVLWNVQEMDDAVCELLARNDISLVLVYTDRSCFQGRAAFLEKLESFRVKADCSFDWSGEELSKAAPDAILLEDGKVYECAEEDICKEGFHTGQASCISTVSGFSMGMLFKRGERS